MRELTDKSVTSIPRAVVEAVVVAVICGAVAFAFNALRPNGIDVVRREPYQILVPCPEVMGEAEALTPRAVVEADSKVLIVDGRSAEEFQSRHVQKSLNVPYDYLEPVSQILLQKIVSSGAQRVIVYGDGADPDSGEQLAKELAGKGIRNVGFVKGGWAALKENTGGETP